MHIMTDRGWQPLAVFCTNEVWRQVSWDPHSKQYVTDRMHGQLRKMAVTDGLPSVDEERRG